MTPDVLIIGGCGRVGLPLGLAFADRGMTVSLYDIDARAVERVNAGRLPADEPDAAEVLTRVVGHTLEATTDPNRITDADTVIVVIGTPVGPHLSPHPEIVPRAVEALLPHFRDDQLLVLRSTVYPGVTAQVEAIVARAGVHLDIAFCPERIAEGRAMIELFELPQIVAARTRRAIDRARALFGKLTPRIVELEPEEAELAKLFTNVWRYIKFAAANQLYMIANDYDLDYERIRRAIIEDYPRAADLPGAGFAAGPCLLKDTMQLADFDDKRFTLGHASMVVNEGLPVYVVRRIEQRFDLADLRVGILGMAFKAESDDIRSSLSYKLKRTLAFKAREVLCTDPYVTEDPTLLPLEDVLERADLLVVGAPHRRYAAIETDAPIIDIWNLFGDGVRV